MAHKKGQGSTKNGRDSNAQFRGIKLYGGQHANAGSIIVEGKANRDGHCRLVRDGVQVYEGRLGSLRRFKDDVREVPNGTECGIGIANFNDVKVGDEIEIFEVEEVPATL